MLNEKSASIYMLLGCMNNLKLPQINYKNQKRTRELTLEIDTALANTLSLSLSSTDRVFRQAATKLCIC